MASEGATESQAVPDNLSFEEALSLLEQTVQALESGGLTLAESTAMYERGMKLARICNEMLNSAEDAHYQDSHDLWRTDEDGGSRGRRFRRHGRYRVMLRADFHIHARKTRHLIHAVMTMTKIKKRAFGR